MHLISKLTKQHKSQEDISAIQDHLSQLPSFQAPYEVLKDLCRKIGYIYFEMGQVIQMNTKFAYYVIAGQLNTEQESISPNQWYDKEFGFEALYETHCFVLPLDVYRKFCSSHGALYQQKRKTLIANLPIIEKLNPKTQEQLIRTFQIVKFGNTDFLTKVDEQGTQIFILQTGVLCLSKNYQKTLSQYEKQVLPRKYWSNNVEICEMRDSGVLGEEFTQQEKALYNIEVISKQAQLLMIGVQQLKNISISVYSAISKLHKDRLPQREEIYKQKCIELEKTWKSIDKEQMLNQDIKKTLSFKVLSKQPSACQDQQSQTQDEQFCQMIQNLSYKKMPTFIQQYFRQKHIKVKSQKKENSQSRLNHSNSQMDSTFDPYSILKKNQHQVNAQQHSLKQSNGFRLTKTRQMERKSEGSISSQQLRPNTSQLINPQPQSNPQLNEATELVLQRNLQQSFHTPKPIIRQLKRMYRSSSVHKIEPTFSLIPTIKTKSNQNRQIAPRDGMFYLNLQQNYPAQRIKVNQLLYME